MQRLRLWTLLLMMPAAGCATAIPAPVEPLDPVCDGTRAARARLAAALAVTPDDRVAVEGATLISLIDARCAVAKFLALLALPLLLAGQAVAEPRAHLTGPAPPCFEVIVVENRSGVYNADETLHTVHGDVVVRYNTVGMHVPGDPATADEVSVVALPPDVTAEPMHMQVLDGEAGRICLMKWVGV